jgi:thiamine transport system permease protein
VRTGLAGKAGYLSYPAYLFLWIAPCALLFRDFFSVDSFARLLHSGSISGVVLFTVKQAFLSASAAFLMALLPSYHYSRSRGRLSTLLGGALFIPFFFPAISCVIAFSLIFSPAGLMSVFGADPGILYSLGGIVTAHAFYNSPIFVKYVGEALRAVPRELVEDAKVNGASSLKIFLRVELPLILPACLHAFFLVFSFCFTSFAVVLAIGGVRFSTIEVEISSVMRSTMDFPYALLLALIQFAVISLVSFAAGARTSYPVSGARSAGKSPAAARTAAFLYVLFEYAVVGISLVFSLYNFSTGSFDFSGYAGLTNETFSGRFPVFGSAVNSLLMSVTGAAAAVLLAYIMVKNRFRFSHIAVMSAVGISSAFLAVALSYAQIRTGLPRSAFLCAGFICMSIPVAYSFLSHHVSSIDRTYIEEAQLMGAGRFMIFRYVELPMLFPVLVSSALQIFAILFGEFTIAYTMQIQDSFPLLPITAFSLESARFARESAAVSSISLAVVIGVYLLSHVFLSRRENKSQ